MYVEIKKLSINSTDNDCFIPIGIFNAFALSEEIKYPFHVGQIFSNITPIRCESTEQAIYLSDKLMKKLCIYENMTLNIWIKNNHIFLGPVVGILIPKQEYTLMKSGKFPKSAEQLFKANDQSHCLLYYFSNENFFINHKKVYGYTLTENRDNLSLLSLPIADIIYEQLDSASQSESMIFQYMRKLLTHYFDIQYINNHMYLGKWELYKCLMAEDNLIPYLPKSIPFDEFEDIKLFIDFFGKAVLKPSYRNTNKEDIYIEKHAEGYRAYFKDLSRLILVKDISELEEPITSYTKEALFVLQQGLSNLKSPMLRLSVLLGKNSKGKWIVVSSPSQLQKHSLELIFLKAGSIIEKYFGDFGEIELIIVLDSYEKPWIIDVNIPPDNLDHYVSSNGNNNKLRPLSILEYSKYLATKNCDKFD